MEIENIVQILIFTHVGFGVIALISGAISMIAKKGTGFTRNQVKCFITHYLHLH